MCSEPMFVAKPALLLQDLMCAYHKRAHVCFEHGGHVKNRIASKKIGPNHIHRYCVAETKSFA